LFEDRNDAEEIIRTLNNGSIPNNYLNKLNKLLNAQNIRNNLLETIAILLSVNFHFPHIPPEIAETLPDEVGRITGHRNGVLLWLRNGDTIFFPIKPNEPLPHHTFYVTQTNNSIVDENADPTPFIEYVEELVDDKETAQYLLEYMATVLGLRKNIFKRLILLIGGGRNGKTTFMQVVKAAFDKLVAFPTAKSILSNSNDNNIMTVRANLEDHAFVVIDEAPPSGEWDLETLKYLSGCEEVVVRELYHNPKTISVTWVNFILTNNYPRKFKQQDFAISDRLVAIRFPNRYIDNPKFVGGRFKRRDPAKIEALKQNTPAIIQAFRLAFKEAAKKGFILTEPEAVTKFTDKMRQRADTIGYFLDKYTIEDETAVVPAQTLYEAYKKFVKTHNLGKELGRNAFDDYLETNNFQKQKINGIVHFVGLRLKEEEDGQPAPQGLLADNEGNGQTPEPTDQDYLDQFPF
jgi:putative DNA primase/helicase